MARNKAQVPAKPVEQESVETDLHELEEAVDSFISSGEADRAYSDYAAKAEKAAERIRNAEKVTTQVLQLRVTI